VVRGDRGAGLVVGLAPLSFIFVSACGISTYVKNGPRPPPMGDML